MAHTIREDILEQIVLNDIHNYAKLAMENGENLVEAILSAVKKENNLKYSSVQKQLSEVESRHAETSNIIRNLYKDKVSGKLSDSIFSNLMTSYEQELKDLEAKIPELQIKLEKDTENQNEVKRFTELIKNYLSFEKLTRSTARMLIDNIVVSEKYKVGDKEMQDVTVTYRFVGNLENLNLEQIKKAA